MSYFWLPVGLALPTSIGWLLLRLVEGSTPVLTKWERWIAGFVLGSVLATYIIFLTEITGVGSFSFLSMLVTQLVLAGVLGAMYWRKKQELATCYLLPATCFSSWKPWQKLLGALLSIWLIIKLISAWIILIGPAYFDDTIKNWNLRAKGFYHTKELILEVIPGLGQGIGSYPQSVPIMKTWLVSLNGSWHEGLANGIHLLWYMAAIALTFLILRRIVQSTWAAVGAYILASLPLYLVHGAVAYADCFLSVMLLLCVGWLYLAARNTGDERMSFVRIGAIATGLLVYTKNEALIMHLPPILVLLVGLLAFGGFAHRERLKAIVWYGISVGAVAIPWLLFKWSNSLVFGNAKGIPDSDFAWQEGVWGSIIKNTFFEGNWGILPGIFVALLVFNWKTAARTSLIIPVGFFVMVWAGQLPIYMFTYLAVEALNQTGYARGMVHLVPIVVVITTALLHGATQNQR